MNNTNEPLTQRCMFQVETLSSEKFVRVIPPKPSWIVPQSIRTRSRGSLEILFSGEETFSGEVNCSLSFTTTDGQSYIVVGCEEGVWIGYYHDSQSLRRVLCLKMVTQCAMLVEFGILLVLSDKALFAYNFESLASTPQSANISQTSQKLNRSKSDVQFFSVGRLAGRTLVIYMIKKGSDSAFYVLEPTVGKVSGEGPLDSGPRFTRPEWFRTYKEFFLPFKAYDTIFLKTRIAILTQKGFELLDLFEFKSVTMPLFNNTHRDLKKLTKRCRSCRPMGLFRSGKEEFLLCYDKFGLYVNRHGQPHLTRGTVEWEGIAEHIAWHPPYVLIFNPCFIEVRHVKTGRLCQIIRGNDIRCTWDGRAARSLIPSPLPEPYPDAPWGEAPQPRTPVCGVMRNDDCDRSQGPTSSVVQRVFELVPTLLDEETNAGPIVCASNLDGPP